jgi:hypothetical protein
MKIFSFLITLCVTLMLTGCEAQITEHIMATLTASAPTVTATPVATQAPASTVTLPPALTDTPTVPPLPSATPTPAGEPITYEGSYTYGFEIVSFKPCGVNGAWWVTGERAPMRDLYTRYTALTKTTQPIHVQLRGYVSERGIYGHMGGYEREFTLVEVLEARTIRPGDCR